MGNIRSCLDEASARALRGGTSNTWIADLTCDIWPGTHVVNPFILYCMTQWWPLVFLLTGVSELLEGVGRMLNQGGGAPLLEIDETGESLTQALVDDWLICGGIGLLLGGLFMYHIRRQPLLSVHKWRYHRRAFYFYAAFTVAWLLPYPFNALVVVAPPPGGISGYAAYSANKTEVHLGPPAIVALHGVASFVALGFEPRFSTAWQGAEPWKRSTFWVGSWALAACFEMQATWDWFYSGAIQTYLISGVLAAYLLAAAAYRGQWQYFVDRFASWSYYGEIDRIKGTGLPSSDTHAN